MNKFVNSDGTIDFEPVFERLNEELSKRRQSLELVCAGGYVMQRHGYRATVDVDAFYKSDAAIEAVIKKTGDEFGINKADEVWLNNSISNMNPQPPDEYCAVIYSFSNLIVKEVGIIYLVGMKLTSARGQDLKDVADILKREKEQPLELFSKLADMGFDIDISTLLDAFEGAYGMDWLEEFYMKNEVGLSKYF